LKFEVADLKVKLNGKQADISEKTVLELLQAKKIQPQMVAVELNEKMLEQDDYIKTPLHEGDQIELHFFMGGGISALNSDGLSAPL
jgi:sulfur carrier protein